MAKYCWQHGGGTDSFAQLYDIFTMGSDRGLQTVYSDEDTSIEYKQHEANNNNISFYDKSSCRSRLCVLR